METFELTFPAAPRTACRVRAGAGALDVLVEEVAADPPGRPLVVVSDDHVMPLHASALAGRLRGRGLAVSTLRIPAGEPAKTRETKAALEDGLADLGAGRDAALVAVGGGVTGDLAGFAAATWHRGVAVVQVPTTLLAMVDAALGGKTAVNLPSGKNLVGSLHQPVALYADPAVLSTLPDADYRDGFAEIVKSAAIADAQLFAWLEASADALARRDGAALEHVVPTCLRIKSGVVLRDERETGRRAMLNFGHTVGHAIEAASGFRVSHGTAVAAGLCLEAELAAEATGFPREDVERLRRLIEGLGLSPRLPPGIDAGEVVVRTRGDKKAREGRTRYALPVRIGAMPAGDDVTVHVDEARLRRALAGASRGSLP
jgi:3-dehydroquinate synthase